MNVSFLAKTGPFRALTEDEIRAVIPCLEPREEVYGRGDLILRAGDCVSAFGLVERGCVNIVINFYWGKSILMGRVDKGEIFAETYAALPGRELACDVVADEETTVLFLSMDRLLTPCKKGCPYHSRMIHNMLRILSQKNLHLSARMMHTASKSTRERLLSFLSEQAREHGSAHFAIPYSRQQLADYLGVERSSMSNELSRMQRDGLITVRKNEFTLHESAGR